MSPFRPSYEASVSMMMSFKLFKSSSCEAGSGIDEAFISTELRREISLVRGDQLKPLHSPDSSD